ncbi:hypothetical protein HWV62_29949 [Athelia sp. TMB]|nr:hypothetical protein HWV62_29949 [Athelia sp. TMB]
MSSPFKSYLPPHVRRDARPNVTVNPTADRDLLEGLKFHVTRIIPKPPLLDEGELKIKDLECIGSYNWLNTTQPTIIVPGSPPEWTNKPTPFKVEADTGPNYLDQNTYRSPSSSLLPLIRVVDIESPNFDWSSVDLITDRNGLRKLLRWLRSQDADCREFRIDTQFCGEKTILFTRWEKRSVELLDGRFNRFGKPYQTYGFSFETASTQPVVGCEGSTGHHRIICYDFAGLKLVVRFEVDSCIRQPRSKLSSNSEIDDLVEALGATTLSQETHGITVRRAGARVPQSNLIELATISQWQVDKYDWRLETYPQMFLSQTPHHFLAVHEKGRFNKVEKRRLGTKDFVDAERDARGELWGLRKALVAIRDILSAHGKDGRISLVCRGGELEVYEMESTKSCLPKSLLGRFDS